MDEKLKFKYGPQSTIGIEKKRLRNKGINIRPKGIKNLKFHQKLVNLLSNEFHLNNSQNRMMYQI